LGVDAVRTTIGVAKTMGVSTKGQIIAVMVMYQESSIRNLANDGSSVQASSWPSPGRAYWMNVTKLSLKYPHDKFGLADGAHDTDSIGLYQQRPAWGWGNYGNSTGITDPEGAVQRLLDPRWEAMAFFGGTRSAAPTSGLLDVNGWENMAPTDAAEAVQGSTQGDLYAKWEIPATTYVRNYGDAPAIALPWYPGGGGGALGCKGVQACGGDANNPVPSSVGAARTDSNISIVVRGSDDAVWLRSINPDTAYQSLGGQIQYGPALASSSGDRLDLFVVGMNGALFHRAGSANGPWNPWESLGGILTASPAVVSFTSNTLDIYGRGADGQLWTIGWTGTGWSQWSPVGGLLTSGPGAAVDRDTGRATVGVRDGRGNLQELRFGASGPGGYVDTGTPICAAPAYATRVGDGDATTIASRNKDGSLSVGGTWLGGYATSAPALVLDPTGTGVSAFVRGGNNALWLYRGTPGAGSWTSLGGGLN